MLRLRLNFLLLLLFTGIVLNIERLDFGAKEDIINLASFVYLLYGGAIISTILLPKKWKISSATIAFFWVAVYSIIKITLINDRPVVGGLYTYITISEIASLVIFVLLTRKVMENIIGLEETVSNITLSDVSDRVIEIESASNNINLEFTRSRRYNRPIGVVVIKLTEKNIQANIDALSKDILRTVLSQYSMSNLIRAIDKELRRPDLILEQHKENQIVLLLPESDIEVTKAISERVQNIAISKTGSPVGIGTASFPEDAVIFDDLLQHAESHIDETLNTKPEDFDKSDHNVKSKKMDTSK